MSSSILSGLFDAAMEFEIVAQLELSHADAGCSPRYEYAWSWVRFPTFQGTPCLGLSPCIAARGFLYTCQQGRVLNNDKGVGRMRTEKLLV